MRRILVGGAWSGSGKTSVVEMLLGALPGWAAIKVTPSRQDEVCPIGACCGACAPPAGPYEIITDPAVLLQLGKDTQRYRAAGASAVAWVRGRPEVLPAALEEALAGMAGLEGVIIESGSLIPFVPGLRVMVVRGASRLVKDSARACVGHVDVLAVNVDDAGSELVPHPLEDVLAPGQVFRISAVLPADATVNEAFIACCRLETSLRPG